MLEKYFIITVDTEGDNLWKWQYGDKITTKNGEYVDRFQAICDRFGFKPVYLTNYEMAKDDKFIRKLIQWENEGRCEIGIHLHAWNTPPIKPLYKSYNGQDYLIEYPEDIMREKFITLYNLLSEKIGHHTNCHRAGRWAMDERYFKILNEFEIKVDCSYTPGINWESSMGATKGGSNYTNVMVKPHYINGILEVPMSIRIGKAWGNGSFKHRLKSRILSHHIWLRPSISSFEEMKKLLDILSLENKTDYAEFMIHSSELMPGGSPYFQSNYEIDYLYTSLTKIFSHVKSLGYIGVTLSEYESITNAKIINNIYKDL